MTATGVETGATWADGTTLPAVLQSECDNVFDVYAPPGALFVAFDGEAAVGCIGLHSMSSGRADIRRLWVVPGHRSIGLATRLMERCTLQAKMNGIEELFLDVLPSRRSAIAWYERLGYDDVEPFEELPVPMVFMSRKLHDPLPGPTVS